MTIDVAKTIKHMFRRARASGVPAKSQTSWGIARPIAMEMP